MPRLPRSASSLCPATTGSASASRMRSAASAASWLLATSSSSTANSSPPKRAAVSAPRMLWSSRRATSCSTSSPAAWPRLSLIVLKSSRSRKMHGEAALLAPAAGERVAHALGEQRAVGQPGHAVVERLVGQLLFERLALADVAAVEHDAADVLVVQQARHQDLELARAAVVMGQRALDRLRRLAGPGRAGGHAGARGDGGRRAPPGRRSGGPPPRRGSTRAHARSRGSGRRSRRPGRAP